MACCMYSLIVNEPRVGHPQKYKDGYYKGATVLHILEENLIE